MVAVVAPVDFEPVSDYRERIRARTDRVRFIEVPECRHLAVDGSGAPGGAEFQAAFGALYPVAYTVHFALKHRGVEAQLGALEGLFWLDDVATITPVTFSSGGTDGRAWRWSLRLPVPDAAAAEEVRAAIAEVARKKGESVVARLWVDRWTEGPCAQILHVGAYAAEPPTIERLHAAIADAGLRPRGRHHEIYVSDPNRTAPERLKTVIRQPVEPAPGG
jgi:hypothetical protein